MQSSPISYSVTSISYSTTVLTVDLESYFRADVYEAQKGEQAISSTCAPLERIKGKEQRKQDKLNK